MPKSDRLLKILESYHQCLVVTHDNPDPDAIAAGWALERLIAGCLNLPVRVVAGGAIVRAENRHMIELLTPPLELIDQVELAESTATILVDCGKDAKNHLLTEHNCIPVAVIDHHVDKSTSGIPFCDIREKVAASATIVGSYLREQKIEPGRRLATAMMYALRTETRGFEFHHSPLDRRILTWLTERADPAALAEIESAPLAAEYFGDIVLALQNTFVYGDAALCLLPRAHGPEIIGEIADLLIRCRGIKRVFCGAVIDDDFLVSVRTERPNDNGTKLVRQILHGLGHGGGHAHRAGGKIAGVGNGAKISVDLQEELRTRWIAACAADRQRGTRLVPKREIVGNL